jgi:hypothetical protein
MLHTIKFRGKEIKIETGKEGKTEYYQGFSISFNEKNGRWEARENRKKLGDFGKTKEELLSSLYARIKNRELSKKIDNYKG